MVTAEELTVAIQSEGAGETKSQIEDVEGSLEDTANRANDTAEEVSGLGEQISGVMGAAVAALAVGAAGLMSQIPVLGETMSGLGAIVQALAFQMDGVLRPVLSPLSDFFFQIANAIFEADGIMGDLIGTIATIVSVGTVLIAAAAKIGAMLGVWASTGAGALSILGSIAGAITTVGAAIVSLPGIIAVAIAAIAGFLVAYLTNWRGTRDKTDAIIGQIKEFVVSGFKALASRAIEAVSSFTGNVVDFFTDLAFDLASWAGSVASDAYDWGVSIIKGIIDGMKSLAQSVAEAVQNVINGMLTVINTAIDQLPDKVTSRLGVEQFGMVDFDTSFGGNGGGGGSSRPQYGRVGEGATSGGTTLDGRQLSESTGRYRSDPANRRGL